MIELLQSEPLFVAVLVVELAFVFLLLCAVVAANEWNRRR